MSVPNQNETGPAAQVESIVRNVLEAPSTPVIVNLEGSDGSVSELFRASTVKICKYGESDAFNAYYKTSQALGGHWVTPGDKQHVEVTEWSEQDVAVIHL